MSVLHPWSIYAGVAAIGLPLAIHFLTRPRPQAMALSTFRFVRMAVQRTGARHRLRDFLVLAVAHRRRLCLRRLRWRGLGGVIAPLLPMLRSGRAYGWCYWM